MRGKTMSLQQENYFTEIREGEPPEIVVGDYLQWKKTDLADVYDPALFTLEYHARIAGGGNEIALTATNGGEYYLIQADSTVTAAYTAGFYHWQADIIRISDSNRITIDRGTFYAIADLDQNSSDPRTHHEIMLQKIQNLLEGKADADVSSYSIAGRSLTKLSFQELIDAEKYFAEKVRQEVARLDAKNGRNTGATVKVRF